MNWNKIFIIGFLIANQSCGNPSRSVEKNQLSTVPVETAGVESRSQQEQNLKSKRANFDFKINGKDTLVSVSEFNSSIFWDLKYATSDNFMHRRLYDTMTCVYVQKEVAERLAKCQHYLSRKYPNYHLLVYDGVRPLSVQWEMWNALDSIKPIERVKFVSNPKNGSVHNFGAAVDITICDENKVPLDMGAFYDDMRKIAYPGLEQQFIASGELTQKHIENRKLLRKVLRNQGFMNIETEWWHFNAYPRIVAKRTFEIIKHEIY